MAAKDESMKIKDAERQIKHKKPNYDEATIDRKKQKLVKKKKIRKKLQEQKKLNLGRMLAGEKKAGQYHLKK